MEQTVKVTIPKEGEEERILEWCLGDRDAANLMLNIFLLSQIADDFVDRDVPQSYINSEKMVRMLQIALVNIPLSPFYQKYRSWLTPVISNSLLIWDATNDWEKDGTEAGKIFSYTWREIGEQILFTIAQILGGMDHARKVIREVHDYYHIETNNDFSTWKKEK